MKVSRRCWLGLLAGVAAVSMVSVPASAQQQQKPNILFIMGDDIGFTNRAACEIHKHSYSEQIVDAFKLVCSTK
jgi:hypothetical protein